MTALSPLVPGPGRIQVRRLEVAGSAAVCFEAGEGPPLVLLGSPLVRARTYLPLLRRLARHFRTIVVELPGSGLASSLPRPWTFDEYAERAQVHIGPGSHDWLITRPDAFTDALLGFQSSLSSG